MSALKLTTKAHIEQLTAARPGETKLGETVYSFAQENNWQKELSDLPAAFVLVGIPEDIGVRANYGTGGTQTLWQAALKAILNVQHTEAMPGNNLAILGAFDFSELMQRSQKMNITALRETVNEIDNVIYPVIKLIGEAGKIPIIIGGGHNNAYPILKGMSLSMQKALHCINLDAHSDYRALEGRHSGNGFRYAKTEGYLHKYAIVGLHKNYNSQNIINEMTADADIHFCFYEDVFVEEKSNFRNEVANAIEFTAGKPVGIELDLDCVERTLSSAATPCGISALHARQFITQTAQFADVAYLHIAEGCIMTNDGREDDLTAKLVSYLVTDFIRAKRKALKGS